MLEYRKAELGDTPAINRLFGSYFYMPQVFVKYENIPLCYVAVDSNKIVGAVKIIDSRASNFEDWEIEFLAVDRDYQRQGIARQLILDATKDLAGRIYGSAWRTWDSPEQAHVHNVLIKLGFKLIDKGQKHWFAEHFCKSGCCAYVNDKQKPTCECWVDTYLLEKPSIKC